MKEIQLIYRENMDTYLKPLRERGVRIWSISRLNNFNTCAYQYYLTYIEKAKQKQGIYSLLGSACHSDLEDLYNGDDNDLSPKHFSRDWQMADIFNIEFPKSRGDIKGNYKKDIDTFYKTYKKMKGKFISELGFILKLTDKDVLMGYIDLTEICDDKTVNIYDFKTSAMFKDKKLIDAGHQLAVYQMALEQLYGLKINVNGWIMLKYSDLQIGDNKPMIAVQNKDLVKKSENQLKKVMVKNGINQAMVEMYITKCLIDNNFDCLPNEIKEQIHIKTHFKEYKITQEVKEETIEYITNTIKAIDNMEGMNKERWNKNPQDFFCKNLCGFYSKNCDGDLELIK